MESGVPGVAFNNLGCPISPKHVDALHCFHF